VIGIDISCDKHDETVQRANELRKATGGDRRYAWMRRHAWEWAAACWEIGIALKAGMFSHLIGFRLEDQAKSQIKQAVETVLEDRIACGDLPPDFWDRWIVAIEYSGSHNGSHTSINIWAKEPEIREWMCILEEG